MSETNFDVIKSLIQDRKEYYDYFKADIQSRMLSKTLAKCEKLSANYTEFEQNKLMGMQDMMLFVMDLLNNYGEVQ